MKKFLLLIFLGASAGAISDSPGSFVNPFIGTSNYGATHPGAQYPHGMASVTPFNVAFEEGKLNQFEKDSAWNSRVYIDENRFLTGFSHLNLSGVGCPEAGVILVMPTTGELAFDPRHYGTTYSNQQATPGYYRSTLDKYGIEAELTSTPRTGLSRFTFPAGQSHILLNLGLGLTNEIGGNLRIISSQEVEGFRTIGTFCYNAQDVRPVYFVARFSKPATAFGGFKKMPPYRGVEGEWVGFNDTIKPYPNYQYPLAGDKVGAYFSFTTQDSEAIQVKVGISFVSIENARANLDKEQPAYTFDATKKAAGNAWNERLKRIEVEGDEASKILFYTALYHSLIHPNIIQDVNGDYPLMGRVGTGNIGAGNRYSVFSLWDTHRNLHPLLSLVYPEIQSDMVKSMVSMYKESGWLPKWELYSMETQVMVGDPATPVIADTYLRGIRDFDVTSAYEAMKKAADAAEHNLLRPENGDYLNLGYVPVDEEGPFDGSVSTSLEYYVADFSLGRFAQALNKPKDANKYLARALNYKRLFDPQSGMLRPKHRSGEWLEPFDPELGRNFEPAPGYIEGSAWNYRFYVPHDMPGLINLLGGQRNFLKELNKAFATDNFDMANEPDITYPFLFNYITGETARTGRKVHELIAKHFSIKPDGIPGNDDAGTLSAWLLFSMMGLYPLSPASMDYALFTPMFNRITIHLNRQYYRGERIVIRRAGDDSSIRHDSPVYFEGASLKQPFLAHDRLVKGGTLDFGQPTVGEK